MYKHILIATDGSELSTKGVDQGVNLAKALGAEVTVVTVTDIFASGALASAGAVAIAEYEQSTTAAAQDILKEASEFAATSGVACKTRHIPNRYAADAIVEAAQAEGADLIVMASHGRRGFRKLLLGSQTTEVLTLSTVPVLVVR